MLYIKGINYIRATGVMMVVLYHFFPAIFSGGFLGVDIFFTVSGFLITTGLLQEFDKTRGLSLLSFYARRVSRLWPPAIFMILIVMPLTLLISPDFRAGVDKQLAAALLYATNYYEISIGLSYENQLLPRLFVHTWTLAVEMHYYIVWGILLKLVLQPFPLKVALSPALRKWVLLIISLVLAILSYTVMQSLIIGAEDTSRAYYSTVSHFYPLMIGSLMAIITERSLFGKTKDKAKGEAAEFTVKMRRPLVVFCLTFASLVGIASLSFVFSFSGEAAFRFGILAVSIICAALLYLMRALNELYVINEPSLVRFLGEGSYGIYLFHWPLFIIAMQLSRHYFSVYSYGGQRAVAAGATFVLTMLLAWLTYRYIETRFRIKGPVISRANEAKPLPKTGVKRGALVCVLTGLFVLTGFAVIAAPAKTSIELDLEKEVIFLAEQGSTAETVNGSDSTLTETPTTEGTARAADSPADSSPESIDEPANDGRILSDNTAQEAVSEFSRENQMGPAKSAGVEVSDENEVMNGNPFDVTIIGDSVTLASASSIQGLLGSAIIDATGSRSMTMGVNIIADYERDGKLGEYVVIALATNTHSDTSISAEKIVDSIGPGHRLIFVTGHGQPFMAPFADFIRQLPEKYPFVTVADWDKAISEHSDIMSADGIHPVSKEAKEIYAQCILDALYVAKSKPTS